MGRRLQIRGQRIIKKVNLKEKNMLEFKFDTQLLIEGTDLDEDEIYDYFVEHFKAIAFWL